MVSDNRWVATTKGIVVFLLTALLFVFWYDRDRELAESHVTAVRFGFYRVIWIEVLCGITVAWCVRKKFRFRLPDAGVLLQVSSLRSFSLLTARMRLLLNMLRHYSHKIPLFS